MALPDARVPSTGATSPCLISSRSPGAMSSSGTWVNRLLRYRVAVQATRDSSADISRWARPWAKLSRNVPLEYISATTAAASVSPKTSAADIDSAATISRPTSCCARLRMISATRAASTGMTSTDQAIVARSARPAAHRARPAVRPSAAMANRAVFRRFRAMISILASSRRCTVASGRVACRDHMT